MTSNFEKFKTSDVQAKIKFIFAVLTRTQVSITDFAALTGVSRTAIYNWRHGEGADLLRLDLAYDLARRLEKARLRKQLPLHIPRPAERRAALRKLADEAA